MKTKGAGFYYTGKGQGTRRAIMEQARNSYRKDLSGLVTSQSCWGKKGSGPSWGNGPEPKVRERQAYFTRIPPPGHILQLAHSGKILGKNRMFWPFGPLCGPGGCRRVRPSP